MSRQLIRQRIFSQWLRTAKASDHLKIIDTETKGRTIIASKPLPPRTLVLDEEPFISVPQMFHNSISRCSHCSMKIPSKQTQKKNNATLVNDFWKFCSDKCTTLAKQQYLDLLKDIDQKQLIEICTPKKKLYPFLALRLYGRILHDVSNNGGMDESWYRFQTLEFAKSLQSSDWDSEYDVFSTVTKIRQSELNSKFFSKSWFERVMQTFHVNVVSFEPTSEELPDMDSDQLQQQEKEKEQQQQPQPHQPTGGLALFLIGSMFNHSCSPNVHPSFGNSNTLKLFSDDKTLESGTELTLSYIDTTLPFNERQRVLLENYGFQCSCQRCLAKD